MQVDQNPSGLQRIMRQVSNQGSLDSNLEEKHNQPKNNFKRDKSSSQSKTISSQKQILSQEEEDSQMVSQ